MHRIIEFRAKTVDTDEWVYGYYSYQPAYDIHLINFSKRIGNSDDYLETDVEIIPETLGQFTGLMDCQNTKVYENDILKNDEGNIGFVRFDHGWAIQYSNDYSHDMPQHYTEYLLIIGDLNTNPELIK